MILSSLAIVSGGAFTASVKVYRERKRKKQFPWVVATERMRVYPVVKREAATIAPLSLSTLRERDKAVLSKLKEQPSRIFPTDKRKEQLAELSDGNQEAKIYVEKEIDRLLAVSAGSLVLTTAGLWVPALNIFFIPAAIYLFRPMLRRSYHLIFKEKRFGLPMIDLIWAGTALAMGHYIAVSLLSGFLFFTEKLVLKTEDQSMSVLVNIFGQQPRFLWLLVDGVEVEVPFESVKAGDTVVIQAGQTIAVDGMIADGYATIDQRTLTGESQPVEKGLGEQVFASTVVLSGQIYVQVEKAGSETVAAQIGEILTNTANFQSGMRAIGCRIAEKGVTPTLGFGALAFLTFGPNSALSILNAGFGYPMRASAPIAMLNFLRIASQEGILIKDGRSLELLGKVDTVVFDKTGTLTEEVPTVGQIYTHLDDYDEDELLRYTAAAEYKQTHPIAKAILKEATQRQLSLHPNVGGGKGGVGALRRYEVGYGLKVLVEEHWVQVGSARFMGMSGIVIPEDYQQIQEVAHAEGYSLVYVAIDEQFAGAIELRPTIRPEARELVRDLHLKNLSTVIISGDNQKPTQKLAASLGIERYFAETLPEDKANLIEQLQEEGKIVCFIGDGINDSIAMKKANVSISLRGASTVATDTAGIILMDGTLCQLVRLFGIGQEFNRTTQRGIVMSVLPGIVCIGGVFFLHWGVIATILLYQLNLSSNILNAMLPLLNYQRQKESQVQTVEA